MVIATLTSESGQRRHLRARSVRGIWNRIYQIAAVEEGIVRIWVFKTNRKGVYGLVD